MKKFVIKSMGCKSNQFEGAIIQEKLTVFGYQPVYSIAEADYFILNSCSVTHKSDNEAMRILKSAKEENPSVKTVLTGCIAQIEKDKLLETPCVDIVLGNNEKLDITKYLSENTNFAVDDIMQLKKFNAVLLNDSSKTRMSIKIQDGCDNRCSYCVIPFARGMSRSADEKFVIEQIQKFSECGYKEVVFTGIHIGQWGKDIDRKFVDLLRAVESNTDIPRYRLGSLNPTEIDDEVFDFLLSSTKFCNHFHLSLQSACNKTLRAMNRFYTVEDYLELIEKLRYNFDNPFIGCDIIVGFPDETDEDFEITLNNLKQSKLTSIHTFPYSKRVGTKAVDMPNQIDEKVKTERANIVREVSKNKFSDFIAENLNSTREVLIEKRLDKKTGLLKGVSRNYLNVYVENTDISNYSNTIQTVHLNKIVNGQIYGKIL